MAHDDTPPLRVVLVLHVNNDRRSLRAGTGANNYQWCFLPSDLECAHIIFAAMGADDDVKMNADTALRTVLQEDRRRTVLDGNYYAQGGAVNRTGVQLRLQLFTRSASWHNIAWAFSCRWNNNGTQH